jgi:RHS repeat-associated protein
MTNGTSSESYTFDGVGNRTASHLSATYTYQPYNRITATATATMSYNANGNLVQKTEGSTTWQYTWDYENRMTQAANGTATAEYSYDALGRRIRRVVAATGEETKFIYDGLDVVMDDDTTTGVTKYQNGLGIDDKLSLKNGGVTKYFLADHLGSTVALTDASGVATETANYDSFGNQTTNLSSRYQYTGREYDSFSGFYYYRARWYDADIGRFISEDPIGFSGGSINLYAYVNNNPAKARDPLGLYPWDWRDFVGHYFTGGGRAVDLANVGLLPAFRSSSSVIERTTGFKSDVIQKAKSMANSECDKNCIVDKRNRSTYFPFPTEHRQMLPRSQGCLRLDAAPSIETQFVFSISIVQIER